MKIQYWSDLHIEFFDNYNYVKSKSLKAVGDILVVAGDCFYLKNKVMPRNELWKGLPTTLSKCCLSMAITSSTPTVT